MKGAIIVVMVVLAIVQVGHALTCGQIDANLAPCVGYLTTGAGAPPPACCNGVKAIQGLATNVADKKTACSCVKDAANRYTNLKDDAAASLPDKCGVKLDIPISRTTDCNAIH